MTATSDTAHSSIPLSLLEALQSLDTPIDDGLDEMAEEVMAKRLGLSPTIAAQAKRYHRSGRRRIPSDEAIQLIALVGRRPDHQLVLQDAGRKVARWAVRGSFSPVRVLTSGGPAFLRRRAGLSLTGTLTKRVLDGRLVVGATPQLEVEDPLPSARRAMIEHASSIRAPSRS